MVVENVLVVGACGGAFWECRGRRRFVLMPVSLILSLAWRASTGTVDWCLGKSFLSMSPAPRYLFGGSGLSKNRGCWPVGLGMIDSQSYACLLYTSDAAD